MSSRVLSSVFAGEHSEQVRPYAWRNLGGPIRTDDDPTGASPNRGQRSEDLEAEAQRRSDEAFLRGKQEGIAEGERRAMASVTPAIARLNQTIQELSQLRPKFRKEAEEDVVRLSVAIAKRVLHRELAIEPAALLGLTRAAMDRLDARELHRVRIHPADATQVQEDLRTMSLPKAVEVIPDSTLERGAVVFETSRGTLDASIGVQLDEIERGLADMIGRRA